MSSRRRQQRDTHHAQRALARSLHAPIFVTNSGRLLLIGGVPDFEALMNRLSRIPDVASAHRLEDPAELGFNLSHGELTRTTLDTIRRSLRDWRAGLRATIGRRAARRARRAGDEHREIDRLENRLNQCIDWMKLLKADHRPEGAPWLLDDCAEAGLAGCLSGTGTGRALSDLDRWYARLVYWSAGMQTANRFLQSIEGFARSRDEVNLTQTVRRFHLKQIDVWRKRARDESTKWLQVELATALHQLPHAIVEQAGLRHQLTSETFYDHCNMLIQACRKALDARHDLSHRRAPAAVAALTICDGGTQPIPAKPAEDYLQGGAWQDYTRFVKALHEQARKPSYDALLSALEQIPVVEPWEVWQVRTWLEQGAVTADIAWVFENEARYAFEECPLTPSAVRRVWDRLQAAGLSFEPGELSNLVDHMRSESSADLSVRFADWIARLSPATLTPRMRALLETSLFDHVLSGANSLGCYSAVGRWLSPSHSGTDIPTVFRGTQLGRWLGRITAYQRLAGQSTRIPKSVRKLIDLRERLLGERYYLQQLAQTQALNEKQLSRAEHLTGNLRGEGSVAGSRIVRAAEEACVAVALDALRRVLREAATEICARHLGENFPATRQLMRFGTWIHKMDDKERSLLDKIVHSWKSKGPGYRASLPRNQPWIRKAAERGINVGAFLGARSRNVSVGDRAVRIAVAQDPLDVFLMGTYFGTCLSQGDSNEMAVLANAHDANKQVVLMHDSQGRVLARQLVTVSDDFRLLGYFCYASVENSETELREQIIAAMADFCGRWARACELPLGNEGQPESLGEHFWYEDGVHAWHASAHAGWTAEDERLSRIVPSLTVRSYSLPSRLRIAAMPSS